MREDYIEWNCNKFSWNVSTSATFLCTGIVFAEYNLKWFIVVKVLSTYRRPLVVILQFNQGGWLDVVSSPSFLKAGLLPPVLWKLDLHYLEWKVLVSLQFLTKLSSSPHLIETNYMGACNVIFLKCFTTAKETCC